MKHSLIVGTLLLAHSTPSHANGDPRTDSNVSVSEGAEASESVAKSSKDNSLVGRYYLSGIMETGSELLLEPGGRFEWWMSYGAVDQFAKGNWTSDGATVTLAADPAIPGSPLFSIGKQEPWNLDAEERLMTIAHEQQVADIEALCPFNPTIDENVMDEVLLYSGKVDRRTSRANVTQALAKVQAALANFEMLAALAIASGNDREARVEAANIARHEWSIAVADMNKAYKQAGKTFPHVDQPRLPKQCEIPPMPKASSSVEADWQRGILVTVRDPARHTGVPDVLVRLEFSDGNNETLITDDKGWAIAPMRLGLNVEKLTLIQVFPVERSQTFTVPSFAHGIQSVNIDLQQLEGPPFQTIHLSIDGTALIPVELNSGRYEK